MKALVWATLTSGVLLLLASIATPITNGQSAIPSGKLESVRWTRVTTPEAARVLELLITHTQGNYEKIQTWDATWGVAMGQLLSESYARRQYSDRLPVSDIKPLMQEFTFSMRVVVDIASDRIFRDKTEATMRFVDEERSSIIKIPKTAVNNERTVVTAEHCLRFSPQIIWPGFGALQDEPRALNKHTAFRYPSAAGQDQHRGDLLDPRAFFGFSTLQKFWEEMKLYRDALSGRAGKAQQAKAEQLLIVEEARGEDGKLYRVRIPLAAGSESESTMTAIWSAAAGFNPMSFVLSRNVEPATMTTEIHWTWRRVDGIFVPSRVMEITRDEENGKVTYRRTVSLVNCTLNSPIADSQFDYRGLGLVDGDLIMDKIDNMGFIMQGEMPVKLANFNDRLTGSSPFQASGRWLLIGANAILVFVLFLLLLRRRRLASMESPR